VFGVGDLGKNGRAAYVLSSARDYDVNFMAQFAVLFDAFAPGESRDFQDVLVHPRAATFSSNEPLGFDVRPAGDFDGDGELDLVTYSFRDSLSPSPRAPQIIIVFGPIVPGERAQLEPEDRRSLWISDSLNTVDTFGTGLSMVGDMNGDQRTDLAFYNDQARCSLDGQTGHCAIYIWAWLFPDGA